MGVGEVFQVDTDINESGIVLRSDFVSDAPQMRQDVARSRGLLELEEENQVGGDMLGDSPESDGQNDSATPKWWVSMVSYEVAKQFFF